MEIKVSGKILHEQAPSIKLIRGQKGTCGWEIKIFGKDMKQVIEQLKQINDELLRQYCEVS